MPKSSTLFTGVALAVFYGGIAWYAGERVSNMSFVAPVEASASATQAPPPVVDVVAAETRSITEWDEFSGRFEAIDEVAIRARVSGYLDAIHFEPGDIVEKGDLLFTIDPRPFETALAEAEARLGEARAAANLAEKELQRARRLTDNGHTSQSVLDERIHESERAAASIAAAEAAVSRAKLDLGFTQIHAPVTGRISDDFVSPGNLIAAGANAQSLTEIVSLNPIHFVFDATEQQYLEYMRAASASSLREMAGQTPVAVRLVDEPEFTHSGEIDFIDNRIDRSTGTIRGRAVFENSDGVLTPGMFGRLRLATAEDAIRVLIPERAIGSDQTTKFVWVVDDVGTVSRRSITLGDRYAGARVVEGLSAGEQVVVSGLHMVGPGAQVTARSSEEPTVQVAKR
ncbi:efflux RND transporter periplasmic adaptor subunit [Roseibium sp. MB-4]